MRFARLVAQRFVSTRAKHPRSSRGKASLEFHAFSSTAKKKKIESSFENEGLLSAVEPRFFSGGEQRSVKAAQVSR